MRIFAIALLLFVINISAAIINETNMLGVGIQPQDEWTDEVSGLSQADYSQSSIDESNVNFGFGDFLKGLWIFAKAIGYAVFGVPLIMKDFGLQSPFYILFSIPVYLIYIVGIAQFVANRAMKSMT